MLLKRKKTLILSITPLLMLFLSISRIQSQATSNTNLKYPKIVVSIVVDQMRWDYLYKYNHRFKKDGGFNRLLKGGFECKNTNYNYIPTVTAAGHSCIYTGTTPSTNGIIGNSWYNRQSKLVEYCTDDDKNQSSPSKLWASTITDELRLATNFKSKVFGVALKDRGSILPAGHSPNGAYWYNKKTGHWVSSSYYTTNTPKWVSTFNERQFVNAYYNQNWNTLHPLESYKHYSTKTSPYYGGKFEEKKMPYRLSQYRNKDYAKILTTPWGNNLTIDFAKELILQEQLGKNNTTTDFLAISFSSTDYVGHAFGPNSVEIEDTYLRLDKDLGTFFDFLEKTFSKDFLIILTADHGVANIPQYANENKLVGGSIDKQTIPQYVNDLGDSLYSIENLATKFMNAQIYLNQEAITQKQLKIDVVIEDVKQHLYKKLNGQILFVVNNQKVAQESIPASLKEKIINGYTPTRSGDITLIFKAGYMSQYNEKGTTHFSPYTYDTHIPLLFYGWRIPQGNTIREVSTTDIAATIAALLNIPVPNASTGVPIYELLNNLSY